MYLNWLLDTFYQGATSAFMNPTANLHIKDLEGMLYLGDKYDVNHVRDEAIRRMKLILPADSLGHWASLDRCLQAACVVHSGIEECLVTLIGMARRCGLEYFLPFAFYHCCRLKLSNFLTGEHQLSPDDMVLCMNALPMLSWLEFQLVGAFSSPSVQTNCKTLSQCSPVLLELSHTYIKKAVSKDRPSPLVDIEFLYRNHRSSRKLCSSCLEAVA
ncbi:hypothetical protein BDW22DRAFT_1421377 [Trametopsis cervina]|nr:hypothetical protein BDW22DRAFT_1421377 [Trametopsis cervina]